MKVLPTQHSTAQHLAGSPALASQWQPVQGLLGGSLETNVWFGDEQRTADPGKRRAVDSALDSFYMSRIGMRFIIEQFVASGEQMEEDW